MHQPRKCREVTVSACESGTSNQRPLATSVLTESKTLGTRREINPHWKTEDDYTQLEESPDHLQKAQPVLLRVKQLSMKVSFISEDEKAHCSPNLILPLKRQHDFTISCPWRIINSSSMLFNSCHTPGNQVFKEKTLELQKHSAERWIFCVLY